MSSHNLKDIKNIIEKMSEYRAVSSSVVDLQMDLIGELIKAIEEIRERSGHNPSERELGQIDLYTKVSPLIRSSIAKIKEYNGSIKSDYIEALKLLTKIQGGKNDVNE